MPFSINSDMFLGLGGDQYSQADPGVKNHRSRGYAYEDPGYDPQAAYETESSSWDRDQRKKRAYWQELLGENYDENAFGAYSNAPAGYQADGGYGYGQIRDYYGRHGKLPVNYSRADEREYLGGASPQVWRGADHVPSLPDPNRDEWGSLKGKPASVYQGPGPLLTMTGQPDSEMGESGFPGMSFDGKSWQRSGRYGPNDRSVPVSRDPNTSQEDQRANLMRLLSLMEL